MIGLRAADHSVPPFQNCEVKNAAAADATAAMISVVRSSSLERRLGGVSLRACVDVGGGDIGENNGGGVRGRRDDPRAPLTAARPSLILTRPMCQETRAASS